MGIVDRTPPTVRGNLGEYNKIIKVASSTGGGTIPGSSVTAKEVIPIGVKRVVIGATGVVYLLK